MLCPPCRPICHRLSAVLAFALAAGIGCSKPAEITRYRVPKESSPAESSTTAASEQAKVDANPDRMLAAIVPHGELAWFFKLSGPAEAVAKHGETFESLVKSVSFPESAEGKPTWKLPDG